jgi:branched-chain amino acid transport system ATP-binding protein
MGDTSYLMKTNAVNLSFGGVDALTQVSIEIRTDEILAIIGPNGAGKSSLLNCINGFYTPQEGSVFFRNVDITHFKPHKIAELGVGRTFQGIQLFPGLTVIENILTGRHRYLKSNPLTSFLYFPWTWREELREREKVEEIIDFLEIKNIRHHLVGSISYGLRKRLDIGRALASEPQVLLMDEPMAGMNQEEKEDLARFIIDIREDRKIPVVIIEHDMQVVMDIADRIYVLDWGHIIAEGTPAEIKKNPAVIKAYLGG